MVSSDTLSKDKKGMQFRISCHTPFYATLPNPHFVQDVAGIDVMMYGVNGVFGRSRFLCQVRGAVVPANSRRS